MRALQPGNAAKVRLVPLMRSLIIEALFKKKRRKKEMISRHQILGLKSTTSMSLKFTTALEHCKKKRGSNVRVEASKLEHLLFEA